MVGENDGIWVKCFVYLMLGFVRRIGDKFFDVYVCFLIRLVILIVFDLGILVCDSMCNCGKVWCRKCVSKVCSGVLISSMGDRFICFWCCVVILVCCISELVRFGLMLLVLLLVCSVCMSRCLSLELRVMMVSLFLFGKICCMMVCFSVICIIVVRLVGF